MRINLLDVVGLEASPDVEELDGKYMWFCNSFQSSNITPKKTEFISINMEVLHRTWQPSYFELSRFHH